MIAAPLTGVRSEAVAIAQRQGSSYSPDPIIPTRPKWQIDALCRTDDAARLAIFFTGSGSNIGPARDICEHCPVQAECLEHALNQPELFGVWGGLSQRELKVLRSGRQRPLGPVNHGTSGGAAQHRRRGEAPCPECLRAHAAANAGRQAARRQRLAEAS